MSSRSPRRPKETARAKRSRYTGVYFDESRAAKPWKALIQHGGHSYHVGWFSNEEEAALAWNAEAVRRRGVNTRINQVPMEVRYSSARMSGKTSRYMGVKRYKKMWHATIYDANLKGIYIGTFETEEDAARAWNRKAFELRGPDTKLNDLPGK